MTPDILTDTSERSLLADLAAQVPSGQCVVELGVFRGGSLAVLAAYTPDDVPVYGVDLFGRVGTPDYYKQGSDWVAWWERKAARPHDWESNLAAARLAAPTAQIIVGQTAATGHEWKGLPVGLLYIDADHSYEGVAGDWDAWSPHLASEAVVVFDDYRYQVRGRDHYPDVTRFVDELGYPVTRVGKAALIRMGG